MRINIRCNTLAVNNEWNDDNNFKIIGLLHIRTKLLYENICVFFFAVAMCVCADIC